MWSEKNKQLIKTFKFKDFNEAVVFVNKVADTADKENHHPKITIDWNRVTLSLSTHDADDMVTDKDHRLAKIIDELLSTPEVAPKVTEKVKEVKLFADGGSRGNPGPSASGYVIMDPDDKIIKKSGVYLGITTNNQAEYHSLKLGLEEAVKLGASKVSAYMDSLLVVNQMKGIFKVKNRDLWPIHEAIKELEGRFKSVSYTHVPRNLNKLADAEVNDTLDAEAKNSQN